ncbi:30S ribosomal protein S12 methylthiotransferase RimO [bacterium]|nr:30S ribosomal protein S12 methylthiotransferase RimO [bacterium]
MPLPIYPESTCSSADQTQPSGTVTKKAAPFQGNVAFVTLGCAKNLVDSEVMLGVLLDQGYRAVENPEQADVIVVNTCAFLQSAVEEGIDKILEMAAYKKSARCRKLIVAGCMVERYRQQLQAEIPEVDRFVSTDELLKIGEEGSTTAECFDQARRPYFLYDETMPRALSTGKHSAFIKISEGCNRPCAFCIIPKIRGGLRSRQQSSILSEFKLLLDHGVKEFNLVAQDLTAYGTDFPGNRGIKSELADLLSNIDQISQDDFWVRLFYAYPVGTNQELIRQIIASQKICNYLDIPLQHVSNSVLKSMRRPLGEKGTRALIESIREAAPDLAIRTTFILGFPGETEADVEMLEEFVSAGHFTHVGAFTYSQEEEADSFTYPEQVPDQVKEARRARIMAAQKKVVDQRLAKLVGSEMKVLVDGFHPDTELLLSARTEWQGPETDGQVIINDVPEEFANQLSDLQGKFVRVKITEVKDFDLIATLIS